MGKQFRRFLAGHLILLIILHPCLAVSAELIVDGTAPVPFQPELITAPNGTPLVNITRPSAGGVSRNVFSEYNVGDQGLILNNSPTLTKTELGGYILANPNLQSDSARLILNEVTGTNPSRLAGYTEIAGPAADLIIANPNGISINGGGFINTPRTTLTTGVSEWLGDNFSGLRVEQGRINIEGLGLNTTNTDRLDIYARAISINADLWARQLNLLTGRNRIDADGAILEVLTDNPASAPQFALDSTVLGGMYADRISLIGTEKGVGVHLAGDMAANVADIHLTVDGRLEVLGGVTGQEGITLDAETIAVATSGELLSGHDLQVSATALLNEGSMIAANDVNLALSDNLINRDGLIFAFNDMTIHGTDPNTAVTDLLNDSGQIETWQGDLLILVDQLENRSLAPEIVQEFYQEQGDWTYLTSESRFLETTDGFIETLLYQDASPASIRSGHDAIIQARNLTNLYATISASNHLYLEGSLLQNTGYTLIHEWTDTTLYQTYRMKHTQYHTACKKTWQPSPSVINGPNTEIIGSVPAIIESGGDLILSFDSTINNGELRENILVGSSSLPEILELPGEAGDTTASLDNTMNALFQQAAEDRPYLIETRPLFADKATFVNSDYLLGQLDYHPEETLKRLGDGFYETVLIRDAIQQQTGQRFLDSSVTSDTEQYTRLMDAALIAAQELELSVGVALNREQIASLTHDIVWFVAEEIEGQTVLVPQLYLAQLQEDNLVSGNRIVAAGDVKLLTDGMINNFGEISAGSDLTLASTEGIQTIDGELNSGNMTLLVTGGSIVSQGGRISGDSVIMQANESIEIQSRHQLYQNQSGFNTVVGQTATVEANEQVALSGNEILLAGAAISADTVSLDAAQDIALTTVEQSMYSAISGTHHDSSISELRQIGSSISGNAVSLYAGEDVTLFGSRIDAGQDALLVAGNDLTITSAEERSASSSRDSSSGLFSKKSSEQRSETIRQLESAIEAGGQLNLYAGIGAENGSGDLTLGGSRLAAGSDVTLYSTGDILVAATEESTSAYSSSRKSNLIGNRQDRTANTETTLKQSTLDAGNDLFLQSGNDISLLASKAVAGDNLVFIAGEDEQGDINLIAGEESVARSSYTRKSGLDLSVSGGFFSVASVEKNTHTTSAQSSFATTLESGGSALLLAANDANLIGAEIASAGALTIDAGRDVNILAAAESRSERTIRDEKKLGVAVESNKDSVDVFFGVQTERDVVSGQSQLTAGSSLTSGGTLTVTAGQDLNQVGSVLAAGEDLHLQAGESINSLAAEESEGVDTYYQQVRFGLTTSFQHNIGGAADAVNSLDSSSNPVTAASRVLKSVDAIDRVTQPSAEIHFGVSGFHTETEQATHSVTASSLYAGRDLLIEAGSDLILNGTSAVAERDMSLTAENVRLLAARNSHGSASDTSSFKAGLAVGASTNSASVSFGVNGSRATADTHSGQVTPVQLAAGRDLTIAAANNIELEGSQVSVGEDLRLQAGGQLDIHAAQSTSDLSSASHQFGAEIGLSVSGKEGEVGYYGSLNGGRDELDRENATWLNTHIDAGNLIDISVDGDARIQGATLTANDIQAEIGGDLLVASLRDTGEADGDRWNAGVTLSQSGSGGLSVGYGSTSGHKDWIEEQTALIARDRIDLTIGGHTQLDAAMIASETGNLKLDTNTFGYSDFSGSDTETSVDVGFGFNTAGGGPANQQSGAGADNQNQSGSLTGGYAAHDRQQEVRATIGAGEIIVRSDRYTGIDSTESLNRDLDLAYEITRDTASDYELYVSTGSLDRISNPARTLENWKYASLNYGHILTDAVINMDLITRKNSFAKSFVEGIASLNFGLAPTRRNHGGLLALAPNLLWGGSKQKVGYLLRPADDPYVLENPDLFMDPTDLAFFDILADQDKAKFEGEVVSKYPVEITEENATYQNSVNGMNNTLPAALANAMQQTGSKSLTLAYNPNNGFLGDLVECAIDQFFGNEWVHSGQSKQTYYFREDVISARGLLGANFVQHSQGNLLVDASFSFSTNASTPPSDNVNDRVTFFSNGSPVNNNTMSQSILNQGYIYLGSNVNPGDVIGETIGGNSGLALSTNQPNFNNLPLVERINSGVTNSHLLIGDKYPEYNSNLIQINTVSPHSGYGCVINCGDKSQWETP